MITNLEAPPFTLSTCNVASSCGNFSSPDTIYTYKTFDLDENLIAACGGRGTCGAVQRLPAAALASAESLADAEPMARRTKHEIAAAQR